MTEPSGAKARPLEVPTRSITAAAEPSRSTRKRCPPGKSGSSSALSSIEPIHNRPAGSVRPSFMRTSGSLSSATSSTHSPESRLYSMMPAPMPTMKEESCSVIAIHDGLPGSAHVAGSELAHDSAWMEQPSTSTQYKVESRPDHRGDSPNLATWLPRTRTSGFTTSRRPSAGTRRLPWRPRWARYPEPDLRSGSNPAPARTSPGIRDLPDA